MTGANLKNFLLRSGFVEEDDSFDDILRDVRRETTVLGAEGADLEPGLDGRPIQFLN
ncbi:MAG: hypothetical protein WDN04_09365 [Rhodospirillales bacterium]